MGVLGFPFLIFAFLVILGTVIAIVAIVRRQTSRLSLDIDNEPVAPSPNQWAGRWPIVDVVIDKFTAAQARLPGLYRPIGTIIGLLLDLVAGLCLLVDAASANIAGFLIAALSINYGQATWDRAEMKSGGFRSKICPVLIIGAGMVLAGANILFMNARWSLP